MTDIQSEYYRYLFNCSSFAIIGTDCQGIIINWNQQAEKLFHRPSAEMLSHHIEQIVPDPRRTLLHRALQRAVINRQVADFEIDYLDNNDQKLTLAIVITPVLDDKNEILGLAAWIRDISNRKKLEQQLLQTEKVASLGTLASGVAHHFNNIIGGVATFVDYALTSQNPDATQRALKMTASAAERIGDITESLLTFAEKDARQFDLADITEVVLTFSHLVEKPLAEKKIKLEIHLQAVPIFEVPGTRMHQILGNLLDNAECAMCDGGTVKISLERQKNEIILKFSDTGCGIHHSDMTRIFDPFFTTRGTLYGGNQTSAGLGLSVVHGAVRELGGTIYATSQLNTGTTFIISFSLDKKKPTKNQDSPAGQDNTS